MKCPVCNQQKDITTKIEEGKSVKFKCADTFPDNLAIRRWYKCGNCDTAFSSLEIVGLEGSTETALLGILDNIGKEYDRIGLVLKNVIAGRQKA